MEKRSLLTLSLQIILTSVLIWFLRATNSFEQAIDESIKDTGSIIPALSAMAFFTWLYVVSMIGAFDFSDLKKVKLAVYVSGCVIALALIISAGISLINIGHVGPTAVFCLIFAMPLARWIWVQRKVLQ